MKITSLIIFMALFMTACQKSNQSEINSTVEQAQNSIDTKTKPTVATSSIDLSVDCHNSTLNKWFGFDETQHESAKCLKLNQYNLKQRTCKVSRNAFGSEFDALRFTNNQEQSIFAYPSKQECESAKEVWESNAP